MEPVSNTGALSLISNTIIVTVAVVLSSSSPASTWSLIAVTNSVKRGVVSLSRLELAYNSPVALLR